MKEVFLGGKVAAGRVALVDDEDLEFVSQFSWHVQEIRRQGAHSVSISGPYAMTSVRRDDGSQTKRYMHSLLTGWPKVDHVNHEGLDNRRHNLRPVNLSYNAANQRLRTDGSSCYKGVHWDKSRNRWIAQIKDGSRRVRLGQFSDEIEAAFAYDQAALRIYGEYACLNFPCDEPTARRRSGGL